MASLYRKSAPCNLNLSLSLPSSPSLSELTGGWLLQTPGPLYPFNPIVLFPHVLCINGHCSLSHFPHLDLCLSTAFILLEFSLRLRTLLSNFPPTYFAKKATLRKHYSYITLILIITIGIVVTILINNNNNN